MGDHKDRSLYPTSRIYILQALRAFDLFKIFQLHNQLGIRNVEKSVLNQQRKIQYHTYTNRFESDVLKREYSWREHGSDVCS